MRLIPEIPFPPYTFVPGQTPHPQHPGGHSYGKTHPTPEPLSPSRWWECQEYLYAIDLFNGPAPSLPDTSSDVLPSALQECFAGFYWEAHEVWEGLWNAAGRSGLPADFLKGLIKLAAAGVKVRQGQPRGVASHAAGAAAHFRDIARQRVGENDEYLGFSLNVLLTLTEELGRWAETESAEEGAGIRVRFDFSLHPAVPPIHERRNLRGDGTL